MELFRRALPVILAAVIAVSCSKSEDVPYSELELKSFEKWMELNINTGGVAVAEKFADGLYVEWLQQAPAGAQAPSWGDYVQIEYRGLLISDYDPSTGNATMFMTRLEDDARKLGTFTYYTHYVPQLVIYNRNNNLMSGMQSALEKMKVGDKVRIFMTSSYASPTSVLTTTYGYEGNTSVPSGVPVIVELELKGIVEQPQTDEENFVNDFASRQWGQSLRDTVREYIYVNMLDRPVDADTVKSDSTGYLHYAAFFAYDLQVDPAYDYLYDPHRRLFLIESNIDSIARKYFRTVSTSSSVSYKPSSPPESPAAMALDAVTQIFENENIRYGSRFEFITTSSYAYGSGGQSPASQTTEVLPYQPVYFYIQVEDYDYGE
ncbi:MAG: FKBP-type peptidyl-prolyl cis-trans isomerase [Rikenellaceae bacterium]|nr:FKBP-type peptidyl-prolyl cis-trans isomerase [Rikenellaceae bacterium]